MKKELLPHLTGFRAIAAYLVLIGHSTSTAFSYDGLSYIQHYVAFMDYLGMSIFFVLSGFVITYSYYDSFIRLSWRRAAWDFAVARFARLYPLYILFLLGEPNQRHALFSGTLSEIASFFTLTQSWWNMEMRTYPPAWSVSSECFFYVCFAVWMLLPIRIALSPSRIKLICILTIITIYLLLIYAFHCQHHLTKLMTPLLSLSTNPNVWGWFQYFSPIVRIGEFIAGVCAARVYMVTRHEEQNPAQHQRANLLCIVCLFAIVVLMIINTMILAGSNIVWLSTNGFICFLNQNFATAPFLAYLFYASSRYPNLLTKWCSTRLVQFGGEISYSVYILQFLVYAYVLPSYVADHPSPLAFAVSFLKLILFVGLTTALAYLSYRIIEMPSRRIIRRLLGASPAHS